MPSKSKIITILEENRGTPVGGNEIASLLGISRNAVWKAITELKEEGYDIISDRTTGYTLAADSDVISKEGVTLFLNRNGFFDKYDTDINLYKSLKSTNTTAKELASAGCKDGTVVIALEQTGGRGRMGRTFQSPANGGIYVSIILRPGMYAEDCVLVTTAVSVAVMRAIKKCTGKQTMIKWVNDIYLGDKKVCGILTEAVTDFETGNVECVIPGIGVNFSSDISSLVPESENKAGSLYENEKPPVTRNELLAQIIYETFELCRKPDPKSFIDEYRKYSMIIGSDVYVIKGNDKREAKALDIDEKGGLIVKYADSGEEAVISSGEVSIRKR